MYDPSLPDEVHKLLWGSISNPCQPLQDGETPTEETATVYDTFTL